MTIAEKLDAIYNNSDVHSLELETVYDRFNSSERGLSDVTARARLSKFKENVIEKEKERSKFAIFLSQFNSILIWVLIAAAVISAFTGYSEAINNGEPLLRHMIETIVIVVILLINATLGFYQEYSAKKAILALKKLASLKSSVIRDGREIRINSSEIVPGDIIVLREGDKVPADGRVIEQTRLEVDESALTGESVSSLKEVKVFPKEEILANRENMVYSGTVVTKGYAKIIITGTGMNTEIGKIASMIQSGKEENTPLQDKLAELGEFLGIITLVVCSIVFLVSLIRNGTDSIMDSLMIAIALAVAAVPEGLPIVVTVCLSIGVVRMAKKNSLIRKLSAVETLGCVDYILTDKTGTLTYNQMTVREIIVNGKIIEVSGHGYETEGKFFYMDKEVDKGDLPNEANMLFLSSVMCNDSNLYVDKDDKSMKINGDPTEGALIVAAKKADIIKDAFIDTSKRVYEIPFDSKRKMMTYVYRFDSKLPVFFNKEKGKELAFSKGALDVIIAKSNRKIVDGKISNLTKEDIDSYMKKHDTLADNARRVIGVAYKEIDGNIEYSDESIEKDMILIGFACMIDPPRKEVKKSIESARRAGIDVVMITGDHISTAKAVAKELGMKADRVITGTELEKMSQEELEKAVLDVNIYARVSPSDKLRIANALKSRDKTIAMTGDGVNDAPALKRADIGIAVGSGTEVAKEASDMIILDDNFDTIVNAVREGRGIYDNIKNFTRYLISCNLAEILIIFIALLIGLPLPLTILHLLWINIVTDGFPALALGFENYSKGIMDKKPRDKNTRIVSVREFLRMLGSSFVMMIGTLGLFYYYYAILDAGYEKATTVAFASIIIFQLLHVFNCRSDKESIFEIGVFSNRKLVYAVTLSFALMLFIIYGPLAGIFGTVPLNPIDILVISCISSSIIAYEEIRKMLSRMKEKSEKVI